MGKLRSGERVIDMADVNIRAARAAAGFRSLGIGPGDTIVIYLRNDVAFFEASIAAGLVGAYAVPANWHYTEAEARYLFENSGAKLILVHADLLRRISGAVPHYATLLAVPTPAEVAHAYGLSDEACRIAEGMTAWDDWLEGFTPSPPELMPSPGAMIYTSGTTGYPKGVRRLPPTPEQANASTRMLSRGFGFSAIGNEEGRIVTVVTGPMYHSAPNYYGLVAARLGGDVILQPRFDAEELLRLIEAHGVTHLHMVPIMFNRLMMLTEDIRSKYDLSSLAFVIHAAAPVSPPIKRAMIEWWGPVINEYYGTTETSMLTFSNSEEWLAHPGTVGRPFPETELRIMDAEGRELPRGEIGEIGVRATAIADFTYHRDEEKRLQSDKAGLFTPGDIGYLDQDGFLYLCDRAKDMVISGGVNIYPAEIEAELHKMPGVADCAIFGIPDPEYGEALCAVVQTQPDASVTEVSVRSYLRSRLAGYKVPRTVVFQDELPREDSGKIFKRKLRDPYWVNAGRRI